MQVSKKYKSLAFEENMWFSLSSSFENVELHRKMLVLAEVLEWNESGKTKPKKDVI